MAFAAALLTACGGGGSDDTAVAEPPAPALKSLRVSGIVTDAPIANASVVLVVGSFAFATTAAADGSYSVLAELPADTSDAFATLIAKGPGSGNPVEFRSLLGSFDALTAAAGSDGVLTGAEAIRTNVTHLSTAEAALAEEAAKGLITTPTQLADALRAIDPVAQLDLAAAIKLVVDNGVPLPAGVPTTLALAQDAEKRNAFIAAQRVERLAAFEAAMVATTADPAVVAGFTEASVPKRAYLLRVATTPEADIFNSAYALGFEFNADKSGRYWAFDTDNPTRWQIDGRNLRVIFEPALSQPSTAFDSNSNPVACRFITSAVVLKPAGGQAVAYEEEARQDCDDDSLDQAFSGSVPLTFVATEQIDAAGTSVAAIAGSMSTRLMPRPAESSDPNGGTAQDIFSFAADGTGHGVLTGKPFTWSVNGERQLQVRFAEGTQAVFRKARAVFPGYDFMLADFTAPDGRRSVQVSPVFAVAADVLGQRLSADAVPGTYYQSGTGVRTGSRSNPTTGEFSLVADRRLKNFALELSASGRSSSSSDSIEVQPDGTEIRRISQIFNRRWGLVEDDKVISVRRYVRANGSTSSECAFGAAGADCRLVDDREIMPVAKRDGLLFVVERRRFAFDEAAVQPTTPFSLLARFYKQAPVGDYNLDRPTGQSKSMPAMSGKPATGTVGQGKQRGPTGRPQPMD